GYIEISEENMKRLQPGRFLNDNLIEFALIYWYNNLQQTNGKLAHQIHIFSTFFYKKLLRQRKQPSKKCAQMAPDQP
ncbi:hypothetical protein L218DRAFT_873615, partial [Marasmius fiardii PR-910]